MSAGYVSNELGFAPPAAVSLWQRRALIVAVVFGVASIIGWIVDYDQFYRSYLVGYMLCVEATIGSLALLMLYHITGGAWGTVIRRILEAAMKNIWLVLLMFAPIIIGVHRLYPWTRTEVMSQNSHLQMLHAQYLNIPLWLLRATLYFILLFALVWILKRYSERQDQPPELVLDRRFRMISGPGQVAYLLITFFMYVDWMMSLTPDWYSMVYPLIFNAGQGLTAISLAVIVAALLVRYEPMKDVIKPDQFLDHGKIMLTFVMIWGWWSYGQWIIYWSGNKPDEISWFMTRTHLGWNYWGFADIIIYFCVPFALLLSRSFKSNSQHLMKLAIWTLVARYIDTYYYVMPSFPDRVHFHYSWLDAVVPIALAALWATLFLYHLKQRPLLALYDGHVRVLLEEGHEHERRATS